MHIFSLTTYAPASESHRKRVSGKEVKVNSKGFFLHVGESENEVGDKDAAGFILSFLALDRTPISEQS